MTAAVATVETLPIEASEQGNNTCLVKCKVYNAQRHYAVCLRVIKQFDDGTPNENEPDCNAALMDGDRCPAYDMRAKERDAGKALFFVPREQSHFPALPKGVTIFDRGFDIGWRKPDKPSSPARESSSLTQSESVARASLPKAKKEVKAASVTVETPDYADVVNQMMKEDAAAKAAPAPRGGLLDTVRKMREQQANEK